MRVALLGAADGFETGFEALCLSRLATLGVDRTAYLARDGALEQLKQRYGCSSGGPDIWTRTRPGTGASSQELAQLVAAERQRLRLELVEPLPRSNLPPWTLGPQVHLAISENRHRREGYSDEINVVAFGSSPEPLVQELDGRLYLSPGNMSAGGVLLVECTQNGKVRATIYDVDLQRVTGRTLRVTERR